MAVKIGHARYDENGKAYGGQAGDQTGREVCISDWYKNAKGWVLLRATSAEARERMAYAMERACANNKIGYDQHQRDTLYNLAAAVDFDPGRVTTPCETDCSALVRVCMAHAGIRVGNFRTANQVKMLMETGQFDLLTYKTYTDQAAYLCRGDILVTRVSGHTVIVLTDGGKALARPYLHAGDGGPVVKTLQNLLIARGYAMPRYGADGDFGAETEAAVRAYQKAQRLEIDGIAGVVTWGALLGAEQRPYRVTVTGFRGGALTAAQAGALVDEYRAAGYEASMTEVG